MRTIFAALPALAIAYFFAITCAGQEKISSTTESSLAVEPAVSESASIDSGSQRSQLRRDVEFLASEELRGRSVADDTIDQAAEYIVGRMAEIGLQVDLMDGSPLQPFEVVLGARAGKVENNQLDAISSDSDRSADPASVALGDGFSPMAIGSSTGEVSGPLVFAGYGITAPKLNYDDYASVDASGAIVIILRKEPQANDANSRFQGTRNTNHAYFRTKIKNAIDHGASAVILVNDPESVLQAVQNVKSKIFRERQRRKTIETELSELPGEADNSRTKLKNSLQGIDASIDALQDELNRVQRGVLAVAEAGRRAGNQPSIPVVSVARDVIDAWLSQFAGTTLPQLETKIDDSGAPNSFALNDLSGALRMELEALSAETSNVIGVIPGKGDLAEQTLVVGAHYDHVGMGGVGSLAPGTIAVHNGADDNASGTAAMLSTASQLEDRLASKDSHRRVVFIAFSAEERGLLGSKHYIRHPRFPLESTVAMINLDMVGRLRDNELTVYGTGSAGMLDAFVDTLNQQQTEPFTLFKVASGYGPSDHQSFYEAGIPVLFFFTGLHNDYHRPSDDFDKIDFGNLSRITDIVSDAAFDLSVRHARPEYAETDKRVKIRRQLTAFLGVSLTNQGDQVVAERVVPGGPADNGGIQAGDRLQKLGNQEVRIASEVVDWVRAHSPGDRAIAVITRDGKRIELTVQLSTRP